MKKRILIITGALAILLIAGLGLNYLLSLHKVTFNLNDTVDGVVVYDSDDEEIKRFTDNGHTLLQDGTYHLIPEGEGIATDKINFSVDGSDMTVTVDPTYSKEHLSSLLKEERAAVERAITAKYGSLVDNYTVSNHTLYGKGEWFGGLLKPRVSDPRSQRDPYRIVLRKNDGKWEVVRRPEYILASSRYKDVPVEILREINSLVP